MGQILWLNGPFGVGKTETAGIICRLVPDSFFYDPEDAGAFLVQHLPPAVQSLSDGDYQNHPPWRAVNYEILAYTARHYPGLLVVPMTVTNPGYSREIFGKLKESFPLWEILLIARREIILRRLRLRGDMENSWSSKQLKRCLDAFQCWEADQTLDTSEITAEDAARRILAGLSWEFCRKGG